MQYSQEIQWCDRQALTKDEQAVPRLIELLNHPANEVITAAADALGHIGEAAVYAWPMLLELLLDTTKAYGLRDTCAYALGMVRANNAVVIRALQETRLSPNLTLARCSREALSRITERDSTMKTMIAFQIFTSADGTGCQDEERGLCPRCQNGRCEVFDATLHTNLEGRYLRCSLCIRAQNLMEPASKIG